MPEFFYGRTFAFAGVTLHEGLWEITTKMEMQGMPMKMPVRKHTQCLTKKNMLKTMVPRQQNEEEECKITDTKIRGNLTFKAVRPPHPQAQHSMAAEEPSEYI